MITARKQRIQWRKDVKEATDLLITASVNFNDASNNFDDAKGNLAIAVVTLNTVEKRGEQGFEDNHEESEL